MISIRRAVAVIASRNRTIWHAKTRIEQSYCTMADCPKPSEIPYEPSNSVNLTGYVDKPVRLMPFHKGEVWGATTVSRIPFLPSHIRVPVIFKGDLARIDLKQNDHVCLAGQLIADSTTDDTTQGYGNVQVMVQNIKFIEPFFKQ